MSRIYKDIHRVQDAIIPDLLENIALTHIKAAPEDSESYEVFLEIVRGKMAECFEGVTPEKKAGLYRRLYRVTNKIIAYFNRNKFDTRKMFLAISEWSRGLIEQGGIIVPEETPMYRLFYDMGEIIQGAYGDTENFEKIDASALKHVPNIHEIAIQEGYF